MHTRPQEWFWAPEAVDGSWRVLAGHHLLKRLYYLIRPEGTVEVRQLIRGLVGVPLSSRWTAAAHRYPRGHQNRSRGPFLYGSLGYFTLALGYFRILSAWRTLSLIPLMYP